MVSQKMQKLNEKNSQKEDGILPTRWDPPHLHPRISATTFCLLSVWLARRRAWRLRRYRRTGRRGGIFTKKGRIKVCVCVYNIYSRNCSAVFCTLRIQLSRKVDYYGDKFHVEKGNVVPCKDPLYKRRLHWTTAT